MRKRGSVRILSKRAKEKNRFNRFKGLVIEKDKKNILGNFIIFSNSRYDTEEIAYLSFEGEEFFELLEITNQEEFLKVLYKKVQEVLTKKEKSFFLRQKIAITQSALNQYNC